MTVKIPGRAVAIEAPDNDDLELPTVALLRSLSLLPQLGDAQKAGTVAAAFTGPPDSVAIIEAGATAASKWWAGGIAAAAAAAVARVIAIWDSLGRSGPWNQPFALLALGLVLGSAIGAIAYLLGSDVRGRAAAMVATIEARRVVAAAMIEQAAQSYAPDPAAEPQPLPLPGFAVSNSSKPSADEAGWRAIAVRERSGSTEYLLVKGNESEWVRSADVVF